MVTEAEEIQAKDFLKRAEIRTMKKDLLVLREVDALKERDKIARLKTLEEQLEEQEKIMEVSASAKAAAGQEKIEREEILQKNAGQERLAEKDLKNYATEQERQQIFLLESQRLGFEKQTDAIDEEKDPALKLKKNKLLLLKRDQQGKLNSILEQQKKLEDEQKFTIEKEQTTTIPSQRKGLQQSRQDLEEKIQEIEKKRWEIERQIQATDDEISQIDKSSEKLVTEKNNLRDKILGADKSLRDIYSIVMTREEEKRKGEAQEQIARKEAISKATATENERVQRQQWGHTAPSIPKKFSQDSVPVPVKKVSSRLQDNRGSSTGSGKRSFEEEEKQRKKFLQDVEQATQVGGQQQRKSNITE